MVLCCVVSENAQREHRQAELRASQTSSPSLRCWSNSELPDKFELASTQTSQLMVLPYYILHTAIQLHKNHLTMPQPGPVGLEPRVQHFKNMLRMAIMWWYLRPGAVFNAIISLRRPAPPPPPPPPSNELTWSSISRYYLTWVRHFTAWSILYYLLVQNAESKKLKRRLIALSPSMLIAVRLVFFGVGRNGGLHHCAGI
ncbi:hypothetical protein V8F33_006003 [Rhypophila sp. PSN 637]